MRIRRYSELRALESFEERYDYLRLGGGVGSSTFGFDRYLNQDFYRGREWKLIRDHVIARDLGRDLGVEDREIFDRIIIHHMNPLTPDQIIEADDRNLDPEFLITTTHRTHNAIHYGDKSLLAQPLVERQAGDTRLW